MKVLWSVNTVSPELADELGISSAHSISWVDAMSKRLSQIENINLAVVAPGGRKIKQFYKKQIIGNITYYALPEDCEKQDYWRMILNDFQPDIIHAYGTELKKDILLIDKYKEHYPIIISLQGIISEYVKYYFAGLSIKDILKTTTVGDILLHRGIIFGKRKFKLQSKYEQYILKQVKYVEGRSDWDRVYAKAINNELQYYYCPRMIRESFFKQSWDYKKCEINSLLVHQGTYPIKGLHIMLDALAILKKEYPDIILYIAGKIDLYPKTLKKKLLYTGYIKYIKNKIEKLNLKDNIRFTGYLNESEMASMLSNINVCVIPSAIENASNALAEAMVVGTPCVASYVGGTPDMMKNGKCGLLYRYDEPEMLADRIRTYFENVNIAKDKSLQARMVARKTHDPNTLERQLLTIYSEIILDFRDNGKL